MSSGSRIKLRHIVPSVVTVFAICSGMTAVRMSLEGRTELALYFVLLAVFLDAADGKLARFLDSASPFGAELDTLADFFNFGIVPGMLLYNTLYVGTDFASLGWLATLVLAVCCPLRAYWATPRYGGSSGAILICLLRMPSCLSVFSAQRLPS